jgi:hypothetical protein
MQIRKISTLGLLALAITTQAAVYLRIEVRQSCVSIEMWDDAVNDWVIPGPQHGGGGQCNGITNYHWDAKPQYGGYRLKQTRRGGSGEIFENTYVTPHENFFWTMNLGHLAMVLGLLMEHS